VSRAAEPLTLVEPQVAAAVLSRALARGGDFAELYSEERSGFTVSLDDGRIERPQSGRERGASVRVVDGDATYFGHVDGLAEPDLLALADSVSQALKQEAKEAAMPPPAIPRPQHEIAQPPDAVDVQRKVQLLRACDEAARSAGSEIAQVSAGYSEARRSVAIFNSAGFAAADDRTRVRLGVQVVAKRGDRVETGHETLGGHAGFELVESRAADIAGSAARKALATLDAVDAPAGKMPVVVGNGFGGVLLHEAIGHGLEADAVQKKASFYAGRVGQKLAEDFVTAYDDGRKANAWGSDGIDDEGTPTQQTTIIKDGMLVSYLYDMLRARKEKRLSTGNGRRESFRHLPVPRMTNTYFAPGEATPEELIAGVDKGLYAVSFGGGQVEPATGDFVFGVSEGFLIEGGKVTSPVRGATLIGNGPDALAAIDGIAGDLEIASGFCGKGGQRVPAGVGQPHVRIRALTVGGTG
jgi:TldD protein